MKRIDGGGSGGGRDGKRRHVRVYLWDIFGRPLAAPEHVSRAMMPGVRVGTVLASTLARRQAGQARRLAAKDLSSGPGIGAAAIVSCPSRSDAWRSRASSPGGYIGCFAARGGILFNVELESLGEVEAAFARVCSDLDWADRRIAAGTR